MDHHDARPHRVGLAALHHDPAGSWAPRLERHLLALGSLFTGMTVLRSAATDDRLLRAHGVRTEVDPPVAGPARIGHLRVAVLGAALAQGARPLLFCDLDRLLVWIRDRPGELASAVAEVGRADCTVFGRTPPAFASHPRVQRDTEGLVNEVYGIATGTGWDITAAARGLSARAARLLAASETGRYGVGTDAAWPLRVRSESGLTLAYREVEGLRFESADGAGDEVERAGGVAAWMRARDEDADGWAQRVAFARQTVTAIRDLAPLGGPPGGLSPPAPTGSAGRGG